MKPAVTLLLIVFFSFASGVQTVDFWSEEHLDVWIGELQNISGTDAHNVIDSLSDRLSREPDVPHSQNLHGLIAYRSGKYLSALGSFETACLSTNFEHEAYFGNWLTTWKMISRDSPIRKIRELFSKFRNSGLLLQGLSDELRGDRSAEAYAQMLETLTQMPSRYEMWILFADLHLQRNFISNDGSIPEVVDISREMGLIIFGLTMFPRSPELNLLRAIHLIYAEDFACAACFATYAVTHRNLDMNVIHGKFYGAVQSMLGDTASPTEEFAQAHCTPYLFRHDATSYQSVYGAIDRVAGDTWWALPNISTPTGADPSPSNLIPSSISRTIAQDGSALHLPSLQVGCNNMILCAMPGFLVADAMPAPSTHFLTQTYDLSMVGDASVGLVYSSHTLEHLSHTMPPPSCPSYPRPDPQVRGCESEIGASLSEWRRVLAPGGRLFVSVPDFSMIAAAVAHPNTTAEDRWYYMRFMFGGQIDQYDFHKTGFYWEMLVELLTSHGFCNVTKVPRFSLFYDASLNMERISLSVHAIAC